MYKSKIIKFLILFSTVILLTSCSTKSEHGSFNKDFKEFATDNFKKTTTSNYVKDSIKQIINKERNINIDNSKRISILLEELGNIDNNVYILSKESEDIFIHSIKNSHKLKINSFEKLNQFIKDTSNYFIYIKKNRFLKNRVKIISVKNQDIYQKDLKNIPFSIDGKNAVTDILEELRNVSGFNIIAKNVPIQDTNTIAKKNTNNRLFTDNSLDKLFENNYISFSGNNIMELLNYISTSFNLYVNIDYENKNIIFEKLQSKIFSVNLSDISYSGSLDVKKSLKNDIGDTGGDKKSVKTKIKLDILDSLEKSIQSMIENSTVKGSTLSFNRTVGSVFVKADKNTMKEVSLLISNFNTVFETQIDFKLEIYEFAVTKEFNAGISLGANIDTSVATGTFLSSTISNSIFDLTQKSATGGITSSIKGAKLNNKLVKLLKQTRHGYILKNSIPYFIDVTDSKSYVKSVTTTTTTANGVATTNTTPETSEINEGTVLSVLAKAYNNKIEFNIQPKIVRINGIKTATYDGNTISLPDLSTNTFTSNIILNNGEKKVIGYLTTYDDVKDYNGIVPLENFILGGEQSNKYFRKETVFVVSATIKK